MRLSELKQFSLIYVGSPYSKWADDLDAAFVEASKLTARLMQQGLKVYSPIAHTHPLAVYGNIDPLDHSIWLPFDGAMMDKSDAMVVAMMDGWFESKGVRHEIDVFNSAGKPVFFLNPVDFSIDRRAA